MRIRVLSYNVHKCVGGVDRLYRPARIAETVAPYAPDFALLQEVVDDGRRPHTHCQIALLGDRLGFRHRIFFPNARMPMRGGSYGNAILSRFPFTDSQNIDLSVPLSTRRSVLHARFRIPRMGPRRGLQTFHVFNLHLGLSQFLRRQQLLKFLASRPFAHFNPRTPLVVAGDFNDVWGTLGEKYLKPVGFRGMSRPLATFPAWAPVRALDSIYVRGDARIVDVRRGNSGLDRWASDHRPLIAEIELL